MVLFQDGNALVLAKGYFPLVMLNFAGKYLQKSRFSRPIGADYPIAVAGGEFQVDIFEERALPKTKA
jgi:hypothetical protein